MSAQLVATPALPRELDARTLADGTRVRLLWLATDDDGPGRILLEAREPDGTRLRVDVPPAEALDAFEHPWLHLPPRPAA